MCKCAECGAKFKPKQAKQIFCSNPCKVAFHNRAKKRGQMLTPLVMASREKRNSKVAKWAHTEYCALASRFREEDVQAGRMSMHDFIEMQHRIAGTLCL